jgi:hypothetical protein
MLDNHGSEITSFEERRRDRVKRLIALSAILVVALVLASAASAAHALVAISLASDSRETSHARNFVIVAPAGTSTSLTIRELNVSSTNLLYQFPDLSGVIFPYTVINVIGPACDFFVPHPGLLLPGDWCSAALDVAMPARGVYVTNVIIPVIGENGDLLQTINKRVTLVST